MPDSTTQTTATREEWLATFKARLDWLRTANEPTYSYPEALNQDLQAEVGSKGNG